MSTGVYESLRRELSVEGGLPQALRFHVAARDGRDMVLIELWESATAAEEFRSGRLIEATQRLGLAPPPDSSMLEVHRVMGPAGRPASGPARRILVVANRTLGSPALEAEMRNRAATGSCIFHLLVPALPVNLGLTTVGEGAGDPVLEERLLHDAWDRAQQTLDEHLDGLRRSGLDATGEVGMTDPDLAVRSVLGRARFDEVIVSTLPSGVSRWLGMDLPSRLRRKLDIPITVLTAEREPA